MQRSQQQLMGEICQMKADKTKEKGSQHNPEHVVDKEETPVKGGPQNAEQHFITMTDVAALLEQERALGAQGNILCTKASLSTEDTQ